MNVFWLKVKTFLALGISNLLRVLWYRLSVKYHINPVRRIQATLVDGDFFDPVNLPPVTARPNRQWIEKQTYFGWYVVARTEPPHWHQNCITGVEVEVPLRPWWQIPDFNAQLGDIKTVWEASRFDWCLGFAQQIRLGQKAYLPKLNQWLSDWVQHNPPYLGVNWKCGQESSIRVMHLAMTAIILEQTTETSPALIALVKAHLQRIAPTISYAIAQNNNHGTSEAAALFIGGHWLESNGDDKGRKWHKLGRKWLENRAKRLIQSDGSFSQYSTNYHRVMLDTYAMVEVWRIKHQLSAFSEQLYQRLQAATDWLRLMIQVSGDVPNLGANDGARLLPLSDTVYRDFRPCVQLATLLFHQQLAFVEQGSYDLPAKWLGLERPNTVHPLPMTQTLYKGGYQVIRNEKIFALLNAPQFTFRPSQADVLHADIWINGENVLMDAGTYSYADDAAVSYYSDVVAHNTVQFDDRPQMPRLSRFLLANWIETLLQPIKVEDETIVAEASYVNNTQSHHRRLVVSENALRIVDRFKGADRAAYIRWHLSPKYQWEVADNNKGVQCEAFSLTVVSDLEFELLLEQRNFSLYYHHETSHQVLTIKLPCSGQVDSVLNDLG
ncbi:MAG: heparinase [Gammaproteobacteria bacterium]|nr:MAG: heparinase [Gammaproteobacteria bacterium]